MWVYTCEIISYCHTVNNPTTRTLDEIIPLSTSAQTLKNQLKQVDMYKNGCLV